MIIFLAWVGAASLAILALVIIAAVAMSIRDRIEMGDWWWKELL